MSASGAIGELLGELGDLLSDLCAAPPAGTEENSLLLLDTFAGRGWKSYHALRQRLEEKTLSVALLALTKSGKSTLLNALIGAQLLPMNNVPETARICRIVHTPPASNSKVSEPYLIEPSTANASKEGMRGGAAPGSSDPGTVTARGESAVRARLQELNQAARDNGSALATATSLTTRHALSPSTSMQHRTPSGFMHSTASNSGPLPTLGETSPTGLSPVGSFPGNGLLYHDDAAAAQSMLTDPNTPPVASGLPLEKILSIYTPVAALLEYESDSKAAANRGAVGGMRLQLLDTPGPNEAGEEGLRHQVERLLDGVDAVLYLLDYTKLKTQDEAGMFERLRTVNPALMQRMSQRLFFVVNKVDAALVSEGQDLEATREYVAELVTRQMGLPGFRLRAEQVLLMSARNALLARLVLKGDASSETVTRFAQVAFGRFANPAHISQDQLREAAAALLVDSGIQDVEAQVLAYLYNHAAAVKQLALVDDLGRLMAEVRNVATSCAAALAASAESLMARIEQVKVQLQHTQTAFETVTKDADAIGEQVAVEVRAHLHQLRGRLFSAIINALDTSGPAQPVIPVPTFGSAVEATTDVSLSRRWQSFRERFLSIFTGRFDGGGVFGSNSSSTNISRDGSIDGGPDVAYYSSDGSIACKSKFNCGNRQDSTAALMYAAGEALARSRSKSELAALLVNLHEDLTAQIHAEVSDFWGVMEAVAASRHAHLLATLNTHLAALTQQVECAVSQNLGVTLSPVTLRLQPPDAAQFHADIDELLAKGMIETRERHIRVNQREVQERVLRRGGGICRWGSYWESVPRVRTFVEAYTLSMYELVPSQITQHFITMVDQAIDTTQASLSAYVSQFVSQQMAEARQQLQHYSDSYLDAMTAALNASTKGSEHRLAAVAQVQAFLERITSIARRRDELQQTMEAWVPRALATISYNDLDELSDEDQQSLNAVDEDEEQHEQLHDDSLNAISAAAEQGSAPESDTAVIDSLEQQLSQEQQQDSQTQAAEHPSLHVNVPVPHQQDAKGTPLTSPFSDCGVQDATLSDIQEVTHVADALIEQANAPEGSELQHAPTQETRVVEDVVETPRAGERTLSATDASPRSPNSDASTTQADVLLHEPLRPTTQLDGSTSSADNTAVGSTPYTAPTKSVVSMPSQPFDYASGFASAMSSSGFHNASHNQAAESGSDSNGESDGWDIVGNTSDEEDAGNA